MLTSEFSHVPSAIEQSLNRERMRCAPNVAQNECARGSWVSDWFGAYEDAFCSGNNRMTFGDVKEQTDMYCVYMENNGTPNC